MLRIPQLVLAFLLAAPLAAAEPPPVERFFESPRFGGAQLSPSGRYLAAVTGDDGGRDGLVVVDLDNKTMTRVASYQDADVGYFQWVNDQRLVYDMVDKHAAPGERQYAPGLFAVNRDGAGQVQLAARRGGRVRKMLPSHTYMLGQRGAQNSDAIYVLSAEIDDGTVIGYYLLRLDTVTGLAQSVARPGMTDTWTLDHTGEPRLAAISRDETRTIYYRDPGNGDWRVLASFNWFDGPDAIQPVGFGADGTLYVATRNGKDTAALYSLDLVTGKPNPTPVLVTDGYDFQGELVNIGGKLAGVRYTTDASSTVWLDPAMQALQAKIDAALPVTVNQLSVPSRGQAPWVLVKSYSDTVPLTYRLFNKETGQLSQIGASRPEIVPEQMGRQQQVRYKARDGLAIPALLTLPRAAPAARLPLVVLVHPGPWQRGALWGWSRESQFLASRGYAVLEPDFRGSTGLGDKHHKAGFKQWGLAMQDDVADAARWAVAQGVADPARICIAGFGYGGYSALMGLVNDPALFRCGVAAAAPTELKLAYTETWYTRNNISYAVRNLILPKLIGDPSRDAAQFRATSPIDQASRITRPLLLAYGERDRNVPIRYGERLYDAVRQHNKGVEWIAYPEEGHGWALEKDRIDYWRRVEQFLARHIGKAAAPAAPLAAPQ